jgi:hypothetical protein
VSGSLGNVVLIALLILAAYLFAAGRAVAVWDAITAKKA